MSDPIEVDDDQNDLFTSVTDRDNLFIIHRGKPSNQHSGLAKVVSKPHWPENLWKTGQLIYSMKHPEKNLPPPSSPSDNTLRFDSRFESGNLSRAYKLSENCYHLILEYDHSANGDCMWFYFKITNMNSQTKYNFYISGFSKEMILFCSGAKIFFYSEKRATQEDISWTHGGSKYAFAFTTRTKNKLKRATLQFHFRFPYSDDEVFFSYAIPYTYSDLLRNIEIWKKMTGPGVFTSQIIGQTLCGRDVPYFEITSPNSSIPLAGKSCIFLTGRIHPGETSGSFVLHGLIEFLISDHPVAKYILDHCIVRIVPMINIDGVVEGSYRVSLMGQDLNRIWANPNPVMQPVVYKTKTLIEQTAQERPLIVYIDFHGHSNQHGTFAFGCPNAKNVGLKDAEKLLPRLFSFLSEEFTWENCEFTFPKERKNAGRIIVRCEMGVVQSLTIEASFGAVKAGKNAGLLYDEVLWKNVGADLAYGIYHFLIPTFSPVYNYVSKELAFFEPKTTKEAKELRELRELTRKKQICKPKSSESDLLISYDLSHEDIKPNFVEQLLKGRSADQGPLKVQNPKSFLKCDINDIGTTQPSYVSPKWNQTFFQKFS